MIAVGTQAPDFTLMQEPREFVNLTEARDRGAAVILFFPFAYSSTCTDELCAMAKDYARYGDLGASVFGISVDSPWANQRFAQDLDVPFALLSDFNKEASAAYGVLTDMGPFKGVSDRTAFVIAPDGTVAWNWKAPNPSVEPPYDEIEAALESL